jgi:hypothetical protein
MSTMKRYLDWGGWFEGLYLSWIKTLTSTALAYVGTNAVGSVGVPTISLNLKQAGAMFAAVTVVEVLRYLNQKPKPDYEPETENPDRIV